MKRYLPNFLTRLTSLSVKQFLFRLSILLALICAHDAHVLAQAYPAGAFVTTWRTTSANESILIPINSQVSGYNYTVNWGDGSTATAHTGNATHTYTTPGVHTVSITGSFPAIQFASGSSSSTNDAKLLTIAQWGTQVWTTMDRAFRGCVNLTTESDTDAPVFAPNMRLDQMFIECSSFDSDLNDWDVSRVVDMNNMFTQTTSFNHSLTNWDVSNVTNMYAMFNRAIAFNQPIGNWNVANVTNMVCLFSGASAFNQPLANWNVSNVVSMIEMFDGAAAFNQPIGNWNVSKVMDMRSMFRNASAFNHSLENWNVSNVTGMEAMFLGASAFDQNLGGWDLAKMTYVDDMLNDLIYGGLKDMLNGSGLSQQNYDATLEGWAAAGGFKAGMPLGASGLKYCTGKDARQKLITDYGWTIVGDAEFCANTAPVSIGVVLPANGYYKGGDVLRFGVKFNEIVTVSTFAYTPSLTVVIGDTEVHASYVDGSGSDEIFFSYTVAPGEQDMDGIVLHNTIRNSLAITDAAGNEAETLLNNIPSTENIRVNTSVPSVVLSTSAISPVSGPFTVTATFSEAVTGFVIGDITVDNGVPSDLKTSDNITYTFTVAPTAGGFVHVSIPNDAVVNIGNNGNSGSDLLSVQYATTITGVTFADASFVYDGTAKSLAIAGTLPPGTTVRYEDNSRTDAGTQEVTATISGGNYNDLILTADLTITRADIADVADITFADASFVYDGTAKSLAIAGTLPAGTTVRYANNSRTDVGTQQVTATVSGANYNDLILTADLTITKADIADVSDIAFADASFVYDGTAKSLAIAGTLPVGTTVRYANNSRTDAGTQEVTATVSGSNYNDLFLTADLTITRADIADVSDITFADASFVYDGTAKSLAIAGTLPAGTTVRYANNSRTDAGTQEVTATVSGANYNDLILTADLTITKADIADVSDITFVDASFVYDGTAKSLAIAGTLPVGTTVRYANNSRTDAGTQEVTATVSGANYNDLVLTADLTITKADIADVSDITFTDASFVYDGTAKLLAIAGTLPSGTTVRYENNSRTDAGTQEVTATVSGSNYNDLILTADLTITKADIADVSDITFTDASFVYDGTAKSLAIAGTLPTGTTVRYANNSRTDAGTQEVTATVSGSNYNDLILTADLTITRADIADVANITFADASFVYDGTAKSLAIAGTLPVGTTVGYANNSRTDAGTQEVTATVSGSNYNDLILTADLTITKADIADVSDITFADASFVYDGTAKSLAIAGTLPVGTTVGYANNSRTDAGTQVVTATVSGSNYNDLILTADLTITKADIADVSDITFADASFVYDGTAKSLAIAGTLPVGTTVRYANNSRTDAGTQEVTATVSGSNYNDLILTADLTITRADIADVSDITFADASFVYDGTAKSLAIAGTLPSGTTVSYENNSRTDAGTQVVTATVSGSNYNDLILTADLTITRADIADVSDITFADASFVYDGTAKSLAIAGTLPVGTTVRYANNSRTDAGTQEVAATVSGANYNDLILTADLTVTRAAITGITLEDEIFVYDGTGKSIEIQGNLPTGLVVNYTNNVQTNAGIYQVTATIEPSQNYEGIALAAVLEIKKAAQQISFTSPGPLLRNAGDVDLDVSANSNLPVTLTVDDNFIATVTGTTLHVHRLGTVTVTAIQDGNANYEAADPVTVEIKVVADPGAKLPIRVHQAVSPNGDGINEFLMIEGIGDYPDNKITIFDKSGKVLDVIESYNNRDRVFTGAYQIDATYYYYLDVMVNGEVKREKGFFVIRRQTN
ncbi:BspA family leucine-rich repeat surface protein [Sphingobacterium pedocola]|uniref:PKD domain-containing protein n=1 Tax=Sphingobacterium pedocola TaxID=2082722 RepID=A0ABR9TC70_9SPHI|nr:BspA family leucine-rich repeat surface protein [Sphingobacterium pedocola]MBE8722659.1 hypothetical protein [Sphingobacterium pedocola]